MSDPLTELKQQGFAAGAQIIADFVVTSKTDYEEAVQVAVEAMRTAAISDSKFNYHLIETLMVMAARGWNAPNPQATST